MKRRSLKVPAAVMGLGVNGLGVVRSLGRQGVPVIGLRTRSEEAGRFSRWLAMGLIQIIFEKPLLL